MLFVVLLPANSLPPVTVNPEIRCRLMGISLELDAIMLSPTNTVQRRSREVKWEEIAHQVEQMWRERERERVLCCGVTWSESASSSRAKPHSAY